MTTVRATAVSAAMLKWARESAGISLQDAGAAVKKSQEIMEQWEAGTDAPTFGQLEKLAQKYRRPLAMFFFPKPPDEPTAKTEFRTLPEAELESLHPDTLFAVREARRMQVVLYELTDGRNPWTVRIFDEAKATRTTSPASLAKEVRKLLGVTVNDQASWGDSEAALRHWRNAVVTHGVYVFKRSFKQDDFSGFCLLDSEFPVIFLNNTHTFNRQIFTLFHELAHILFDTSGVTLEDDSFIDNLPSSPRKLEIACNRFAAEFLVPSEDLTRQLKSIRTTPPCQ